MAECIERANLIARIKYYVTHTPEGKGEHYAYSVMLNEVLNCPAADVAPVVRCKDCENAQNECGGMIICRVYKHIMWLQDFCSYGKRKGGGADNG